MSVLADRSKRTFPTRKEFAAWRKENPRRGERGNPTACPLALCLGDRGAPAPSVGPSSYSLTLWDFHDLPLWASSWANDFDNGEAVA